MSIQMKAGRLLNAVLTRFGYKMVICDRKTGSTFTERQLIRSLSEMNALYTRFVFDREVTIDEETLKLLSLSMYTRFNTGFHLIARLRLSLAREGDVCEFGVGQGVISALLAHEIRDTRKNLWLFDSFEGLSAPTGKDVLISDFAQQGSIEGYAGTLSFPETMVRTRLRDIRFHPSRTKIVPGFIEKTIHGPDLPQAVCFAYVDFDFYEPIHLTLEFLDTVLVPGGFLIVDDYGTFSQGAKTAADEFFEARKEKYLRTLSELPCGNFCILQKKP